jgi:hypothetical protein
MQSQRSVHGLELSAGAGAKVFGSFLQKRTSFLTKALTSLGFFPDRH